METTDSPARISIRFGKKPGQLQALHAARVARKATTLLEEAFQLMVEDDCLQPATEYLYAALCEAETRASVLEDWYERTYSGNILSA